MPAPADSWTALSPDSAFAMHIAEGKSDDASSHSKTAFGRGVDLRTPHRVVHRGPAYLDPTVGIEAAADDHCAPVDEGGRG